MPHELREIERVLIAAGSTEESVASVIHGKDLAKRFDADLHTAHVILPIPPAAREAIPELEGMYAEKAREEFEEFDRRNEIAQNGTVHVTMGEPEHVILDMIKENNIDLLVLGRFGKGGPKSERLGSVACRLLRNCPISVLLVHPQKREPFTNISVATSFDDEADTLVQRAIHLAKMYGLESINILNAYHLPRGYHHCMSEEQAAERLEQLAERRTNHLQEQYGDAAGVRLTVVAKRGEARSVIPELVDETGTDLLVVGTHNRSTPAMFMLGRTTEAIINHVDCAVWATKKPEWYHGLVDAVGKMLGH